MTGVGGERRLLSGGTGFSAISGIVPFTLIFVTFWRGYIVISSTIAIFLCGKSERFCLSSG